MNDLGPLLGCGRRAEVYALSTGRIFKRFGSDVSPDAVAREAASQIMARAAGLPVPSVHGVHAVAGRIGIEMDSAPGLSLGDAMLRNLVSPEEGLRRMLRLHLAIHARAGDGLPALQDRLKARIAASGLPPGMRDHMLVQLASQPPQCRLCHCDFHPFNIVGPAGEEQIIDWADAARGSPLADVCLTVVLIAPHDRDLALRYLDLYLSHTGVSRDEAALWLPIVAAARLSEGIADERPTLLHLTNWLGNDQDRCMV